MLCERCGKNEANVHITKNINGRVTQMNLCSECAESSGEITSFNDMFSDFFSSVMPARARRFSYRPSQALNSYAGCEDCLEDAYPKIEQNAVQTDEEKIKELKQQLKTAVENEEYEKAAKLRDEIKALENKKTL